MAKASTWWGRALLALPIRVRSAILLPIIAVLVFVPFFQAVIECFWSRGFSCFIDESADCYAPYCRAFSALVIALKTGQEQ